MKRRLPLLLALPILLVATLGGFGHTAVAQYYRYTHPTTTVIMGGDACAMTAGTSALCVTNHTSWPILQVEAVTRSAFDPGAWINIGGGIMPGQTKIVRFPVWQKGTCVMHIYVKTPTQQHGLPDVDVCRTTRITVNGW